MNVNSASPTLSDTRFRVSESRAKGHAVRFFEQSEYPSQQIGEYLHQSLADGGGALVFASAPHRRHISVALRRCGDDVPALIESGLLVWGDADEVARSVVIDGVADEATFQRLVGDVVNQSLARHGHERAYGEIVDVLVRAGDPAAALQLERWWNQLLYEKPVELLCGYALNSFADAEAATAFRHVCDEHEKIELNAKQDNREYSCVAAELQQATVALRTESRRRMALEHARDRLRAQMESANRHFAGLQRLTSAMSEVTRPAEIARVAVMELEKSFGADVVAIGVAIGEKRLSLLDHANLTPAQIEKYRMISTDAPLPLTTAYRTRTPVWLFSASEIAQHYPTMLNDRPDLQAIGSVPLVSHGRALGVIELAYKVRPQSATLPRRVMEDCAKAIATMLDHALAHEDAQRACLRLQRLTDAAGRIGRVKLDLPRTMETLAHEITHGFADCCVATLRAADGNTLTLAALQHVDSARGAVIERAFRATPVIIGEGVLGNVAKTGRATRITAKESILELSDLAPGDYLNECPIVNLMTVPLLASGEVIGTLSASRRLDQPFTEEDEQLLRDLAGWAASAIENALLYEHARREHERAESANVAKDEFLAMLGHELRNPLAPILTAAQIMQMRTGNLLAKERTIIERQVNHMVRLVDDLLDISRITRGKIELNRKPIELTDVVANAVEVANALLEERHHRLIASVASGLIVEADGFRLSQVVANLLINAAKYTPNNGTIELVAKARAGKAVLRVRDNGIGIEPDLLPRVFDLFIQGRQTTNRTGGGLGLGLAIARRLIELHGGTVRAYSAGKGKGSEFVMELPLMDGAQAHEQQSANISCIGGRKILVVDDNVDAAQVLSELLGMIGHSVQIAHDGPSALAVAETFRPDLALLNIGLPEMDGHELGQRLRAACTDPCPKLIAITGYGQATDRRRSKEAGFVSHLVKPIDFDRLQGVIEDCFLKS